MGQMLDPIVMRRLRSEVGSPINPPEVPTIEVSLPVDLSREQRECYRAVLARYYELLTDPKPPRHAGHRAAQMLTVCSELRKVGFPTAARQLSACQISYCRCWDTIHQLSTVKNWLRSCSQAVLKLSNSCYSDQYFIVKPPLLYV